MEDGEIPENPGPRPASQASMNSEASSTTKSTSAAKAARMETDKNPAHYAPTGETPLRRKKNTTRPVEGQPSAEEIESIKRGEEAKRLEKERQRKEKQQQELKRRLWPDNGQQDTQGDDPFGSRPIDPQETMGQNEPSPSNRTNKPAESPSSSQSTPKAKVIFVFPETYTSLPNPLNPGDLPTRPMNILPHSPQMAQLFAGCQIRVETWPSVCHHASDLTQNVEPEQARYAIEFSKNTIWAIVCAGGQGLHGAVVDAARFLETTIKKKLRPGQSFEVYALKPYNASTDNRYNAPYIVQIRADEDIIEAFGVQRYLVFDEKYAFITVPPLACDLCWAVWTVSIDGFKAHWSEEQKSAFELKARWAIIRNLMNDPAQMAMVNRLDGNSGKKAAYDFLCRSRFMTMETPEDANGVVTAVGTFFVMPPSRLTDPDDKGAQEWNEFREYVHGHCDSQTFANPNGRVVKFDMVTLVSLTRKGALKGCKLCKAGDHPWFVCNLVFSGQPWAGPRTINNHAPDKSTSFAPRNDGQNSAKGRGGPRGRGGNRGGRGRDGGGRGRGRGF